MTEKNWLLYLIAQTVTDSVSDNFQIWNSGKVSNYG
jgi:hypothetical protein